jgi:hypothetical protein
MNISANSTQRQRIPFRTSRTILLLAAIAAIVGACGGEDRPSEAQPRLAEGESSTTTEDSQNREELAAMFPISVDTAVEDFDLVGGYTMSLTEAYCDGLASCGTRRPDVHADIIEGSNGLELQIPNVLTAGLFATNGSLFAVTDSDQIMEACGDTHRNARVSITMFANGITVTIDGTETLTGLGASMLVEGNEVADCPEGVVFYAAELTPD